MSLRAAARVCADYTPKAEARLLRIERRALGVGHAAEHARARARGRRQACAPGGKLRHGFVAKVKTMSRSRAKRSHATGPPSVVGQWSGRTHIDVTGIHAVVLPTGKVLYFSYGGGDTGIASIWDPVSNTSHRVDPPAGAHSPRENIWCGGQTLLADGRVLVVGGNIPNSDGVFRGLDTIYLFDPWTETWTLQGRMREGRWYPTATQLPNNQVVITSGLKRDGSGTINPDVEVFTPNPDPAQVGTITYVGAKSLSLYPRQNVVKDGRVLVSGPTPGDTDLLDPATWTWSSVPNLAGGHFYGGAVLLPSGPDGSSRVMVIAGDQSSTTEVIDTTNLGAGWSFRASLPQTRRNANSVLTPDGAIITIGGNGANDFDSPRFEALRYDPAANTWTELAAQAEPRAYHSTAVLLPDGRVVSAGDDGPAGGGGQSDEIEVFSPPYLFKSARPTITSAPAQVGFGAQFTVGSAETNVTSAVLVAPGATTHANDMHQRLVPLVMSPVSGGYALTAPASANIAPPGYYMLFLVNSDGVPSVARMIRVDAGQPPGDATPPSVAVSAPAPGATVFGTIPVSANASDDVGVVGVQFTLDGANLGAEDTSAPYSVSWNTTTASDGPHTLRAIARDASGKSTTSAAVGVTVSNATPPPSPGLVAAYGFEETAGAVIDSSGQNNAGTIVNNAARTAAGKIGRAIDFDGVNDYVSVADANSLDLTTGMTLEAWVQLDTVSSWRTAILKEKPGSDVYALYSSNATNNPQGEFFTSLGRPQEGRRAAALERGHLDPPGRDLRRGHRARLPQRRPERLGRRRRPHRDIHGGAADRRQPGLGRVHRRAHRRGARLQPAPVGGRDHHRHDQPGGRRDPAARRRHPAERGRLGPGARRQRLRHHPGERQRLRRRRRGRGPVHPRRGQPGRRGHQRPLLGQLEHHHRLRRPPHPARDRPRRLRQIDHLGGRRRDGLERRARPTPPRRAWPSRPRRPAPPSSAPSR